VAHLKLEAENRVKDVAEKKLAALKKEKEDKLKADLFCASCGVVEIGDIKLKKCDDCDLVRYCSEKCQQDHHPKHEEMCKERAAELRAAELRDEILFRQPGSTHDGDCPICFLPLPFDPSKVGMYSCCSKLICKGCLYANLLCQLRESGGGTCPFCRHPAVPKSKEEHEKSTMKRVGANDPFAVQQMGMKYYEEGDYEAAFKYWTKGVELGDAAAHFQLSVMYLEGKGIEKDEKKVSYHLEEAAIAGHPEARFILGCDEGDKGRFERAAKHFIIAANLGCDKSIQALKSCYAIGAVSKEDFAVALRGHQAALDAMKSPLREAAAKADAAGAARG